jgi:hypothetical protein
VIKEIAAVYKTKESTKIPSINMKKLLLFTLLFVAGAFGQTCAIFSIEGHRGARGLLPEAGAKRLSRPSAASFEPKLSRFCARKSTRDLPRSRFLD